MIFRTNKGPNMRRLLLLSAVLLAPSVAFAQGIFPDVKITNETTEISAATTASARATTCMSVRGGKFLILHTAIDADGSPVVTGDAITCNAYRTSDCSDTIPFKISACSGNTCTASAPSWAFSAGDFGFLSRWDIAGVIYAKCTNTFTTGDAGDTITQYRTVTKE